MAMVTEADHDMNLQFLRGNAHDAAQDALLIDRLRHYLALERVDVLTEAIRLRGTRAEDVTPARITHLLALAAETKTAVAPDLTPSAPCAAAPLRCWSRRSQRP